MEDVAGEAEVSVATVYNYFGNKRALLIAGVETETDDMIARGATVLARPGRNPVKAVQRLIDIYAEDLCAWDRGLLREVFSAAFQRSGGEELTRELAAMDQRLIEQLAALLADLQAKEKLRSEVDVYEATLLIFSVFVLQLFMFISIEGLSSDDLRKQVRRQIDLVFTGLAPQPSTKAKST
jgi:AcrR family transcriptional regulator